MILSGQARARVVRGSPLWRVCVYPISAILIAETHKQTQPDSFHDAAVGRGGIRMRTLKWCWRARAAGWLLSAGN